jgi:flagellar protein FliS
MANSARENYLATEVLTAPPQKLHLMLIEAAIRLVERARQHWRAHETEQATEAIVRAEDVLGELMAGLNRGIDTDLVKKTAGLYLFVFRALMEANARKDETKLDEALKVLQVQRETWRQLCERLVADDTAAKPGLDTASFRPASTVPPPRVPPLPADTTLTDQYSGGFSLDA